MRLFHVVCAFLTCVGALPPANLHQHNNRALSGDEEYVGLLAHVPNNVITSGVGFNIKPGDLEFENDSIDVVFHPIHADEENYDGTTTGTALATTPRLLSEDIAAEFAEGPTHYETLTPLLDCTTPSPGVPLTAAVDAFTCYTLPVNPLLQMTSYSLTVTAHDNEEIELFVWSFFEMHDDDEEHDHEMSRLLTETDSHAHEDHEAFESAFQLTAAITGNLLEIEAFYMDGEVEEAHHDDEEESSDHEEYVGLVAHVPTGVITSGVGVNIVPGCIEFENNSIDIIIHPIHADEEGGHDHRRSLSEEDLAAEFAEGPTHYETLTPLLDCTTPSPGVPLTAAVDAFTCYTLPVNPLLQMTSYSLTVTAHDNEEIELFVWIFFVAHVDEDAASQAVDSHDGHNHGRLLQTETDSQEEFENAFQLTNANTGTPLDIEASYLEGQVEMHNDSSGYEPAPTWMPYVASVIVNLVTFIGVLFTFPIFRKCMLKNGVEKYESGTMNRDSDPESSSDELELTSVSTGKVEVPTATATATATNNTAEARSIEPDDLFTPDFLAYTSSFSVGAILSCAFLLIIPEAIEMIHDHLGRGEVEMVDVYWRWGTCLLAGFIFPYVLSTVIMLFTASSKNSTRIRVVSGILIGDFFHNFTDGTFIAAAFLSCDANFGWAVALSTIIHELAQEIADYVMLTTVGGFKPYQALLLNFISGTSVIFGCMLVTLSNADTNALGYILTFGGGLYITIAASECMPRVYKYADTSYMRFISFLFFAVGAVGIGLILLDHKHCEVGGDHDGHNH